MTPDAAPTLRRSRDFGDILNLSFQLLRRDYKLLARSLAIFVLPFGVVAAIGQAVFLDNWVGLMPSMESLENANWVLIGSGYGLLLLGWMLVLCAASTVTLSYLALYDEGEGGEVDPDSLMARSKQNFWPILKYWALTIPIGLVAIVMAMIPCLGAVAVMVGAFYAYPRFFIGSAVLVAEDLRPSDAMRRGFSLVTDHYWQTFGIIFIAGILAGILGSIFSVPTYILVGVNAVMTETGSGPGPLMKVLAVTFTVLGTLASALFYAYTLLPTGIQYYNLIERKEHTGLMERVKALEGPGFPETSPLG